jgi:hypothetical protein
VSRGKQRGNPSDYEHGKRQKSSRQEFFEEEDDF